ncbi:MAG: hypothetical protein L0Y56_17025 [Nitrospira sp.]|nr:hypothetical protein [Nitrospira sp.]
MKHRLSLCLHPWLLLGWVGLLGFFFAEVEIQIEGGAGWAANLPTWRVEEHWLLDIFWGSRPLTGYHAWVFSFMALIFHLPVFVYGHWTLKVEARIFGCLMAFWVIEDFLWFMLNPAFGLVKFHPGLVPWHKHWFFLVPLDYAIFSIVGLFLIWYSFHNKDREEIGPF